MRWWTGYWLWEPLANNREVWREIPELKDVPRVRALDVFERAVERSWGMVWTWVALGALGVGIVGGGYVLIVFVRFPMGGGWAILRGVMFGVLPAIVMSAYFRLRRMSLRRCVRAELGTHCGGCDYDLRGTPDLPRPGVARCPECGKAIPRNVHRGVVVGARLREDGEARN